MINPIIIKSRSENQHAIKCNAFSISINILADEFETQHAVFERKEIYQKKAQWDIFS